MEQHHAALPHDEVGKALAKVPQAVKLCYEFIVLTASRQSESRLATWGEIDLKAKVWTVPAERMKDSRAHRVPLSSRAMEILAEADKLRYGDLVFPGARGKPLGEKRISTRMHTLLGLDTAMHGYRSSFKDWAGETGFDNQLSERALAHVVHNAAEAAYNSTDLLEQRWGLARSHVIQWLRQGQDGRQGGLGARRDDGPSARQREDAPGKGFCRRLHGCRITTA